MCGIVGYIGAQSSSKTTEFLLTGLQILKYRGYDSAGIAIFTENQIQIKKVLGDVEGLSFDKKKYAHIGLGHTRWATHGKCSLANAHPHKGNSGRFALVHNGIIENYEWLKNTYLQAVQLTGETDSEILVHVLSYFVEVEGMSTFSAFQRLLHEIKGSYAIVMMDAEDVSCLYVARQQSPLLLGVGKDAYFIASDVLAMTHYTQEFIELKDGEMARVSPIQVELRNLLGEPIQRNPFSVEPSNHPVDKGLYPHYMLKEIEEQPSVLRRLLAQYQNGFRSNVKDFFHQIDRLYIIACGTSYHAGLIGKTYFEKQVNIGTEVHIASEFLTNDPLLSKKPGFLFITQSGETADTLQVLNKVKKEGFPTLTITNTPSSSMARSSDCFFSLYAGPEISVASTKAYTAQVAILYLLSLDLSFQLETNLHKLNQVIQNMEWIITQKDSIAERVRNFLKSPPVFFIGRGLDFAVALEGALKLKEVSYLFCEAFPGGELKHGPIAMIEDNTSVIALNTQEETVAKMKGTMQEIQARGAKVWEITANSVPFPVDPFLIPLVSILYLQLMAYYAAVQRNVNVDQPKNLAKSVTVL